MPHSLKLRAFSPLLARNRTTTLDCYTRRRSLFLSHQDCYFSQQSSKLSEPHQTATVKLLVFRGLPALVELLYEIELSMGKSEKSQVSTEQT